MDNLTRHLNTILIRKGGFNESDVQELLIQPIDLLSTDPRKALRKLLLNPVLKELADGHKNTLKTYQDKQHFLKVYTAVTSHAMIRLINDTFGQDYIAIPRGEALQKNIIVKLLQLDTNLWYTVSFQIYQIIYDEIRQSMEASKENTSMVYYSSENSERSAIISDLGLHSFAQIITNFTNFKLYRKNSASPTIVFSAVLKPETAQNLNAVREPMLEESPIFFKLERADIHNPEGRLLRTGYIDTEVEIYRELLKLVEYNMTPHILCTVTTNRIVLSDVNLLVHHTGNPDFGPLFGVEMKKINRYLERLMGDNIMQYKEYLDTNPIWKTANICVTQAGQQTIDEFLKKATVQEYKNILFQMLYTLYIFEKIQFCHADLHQGNIFINTNQESIYHYVINEKVYRVPITHLVKIFDFDSSTIYKETFVKVNSKDSVAYLRMNPGRHIKQVYNDRTKEGITDVFNKNVDKIKFLYMYFDRSLPTEIKELIGQMIPGFKSGETIRATYNRLLFRGDVVTQQKNREEATRIFRVNINDPSDIDKFGIHKSILDSSWIHYFSKFISLNNFIQKNGDSDQSDHLWIPDNIALPYEQMFNHVMIPVEEEINVRDYPVYTIDGRLIDLPPPRRLLTDEELIAKWSE